MEKLNYIHQNPVRAKLVNRAVDYRWSSARIWQGCPSENEPLQMDKDLIYCEHNQDKGRARTKGAARMKSQRYGAASRASHPAAKP
jgi:hypothetical protein